VFFLFAVWLQRAFRCQREAVVGAERGTVKKVIVSETVRGLGFFLLSRSCRCEVL